MSIKDEVTGELRSTFDILKDLKPAWDNMTNAQQVSLGQTLAGVNQYKIFSAIMSNFDTAISASTESLISNGATIKQNDVYMSGLQAKLNMLKKTWQDFLQGKGGLKDFGSFIVGLINNVLKLVQSLGGLKTIIVTIAISLLPKLITTFKTLFLNLVTGQNFIGKFISTLTLFRTQTQLAKLGYTEFGGTVVTTNELIQASIPIIGLVVAGVSGLIGLFSSFSNKTKDVSVNMNELTNEYENFKNKNDDVLEKLSNENISREELNNIIETNLDKYKQELDSIDDVNKKRETAIELIKQMSKEEAKEAAYKGVEQYKENLERKESTGYSFEYAQKGFATSKEVKDFIDKMSEYFPFIFNAGIFTTFSTTGIDDYVDALRNALELLESPAYSSSKLDKFRETISKEYAWATNKLKEINDEIEKEEYLLAQAGLDFVNGAIVEAKAQTQELEESLEDEEEQISDLERTIKKLDDSLKDLSSITLDGTEQAFDKASKALKQLNEDGQMNVQTYEDLMSVSSDYLPFLISETGEIKDNVEAEHALYRAKIDEMAVTKAKELVEKAIDLKKKGTEYSEYARNIDTATASMWGLVESEITEAEIDGKISKASANVLRNQTKAIREWANQAKDNISKYDSYSDSVDKSTTKTKENTKALKENADALKIQKETLENEVKDYEKAIKYIEGKIDDEINALKELQKAEKDTIKNQIDALKDKKEKESDYWDEKIQALKDQNDALNDQIEYEKLLQDLEAAKSKKVKVYKEGQGFVYDVDQNEVNKAQQKIDEYNRKKAYEDELALLEKNKKDKLKLYDDQIKDLENYEKQVEDKYNKQIKYYEDLKKKFKKNVDNYETEQNRQNALQLTGIDFEKKGWDKRLSNLDDFLVKYKEKQAQLTKITEEYNKAQKAYDESKINDSDEEKSEDKNYRIFKIMGSYGSSSKAKDAMNKMIESDPKNKDRYSVFKYGDGYVVAKKTNEVYKNKSDASARVNILTTSSKGKEKYGYKQYASGIASVSGNQIAITGENPNKEIVLGSKANGVLTSIDNGGGVVNATSTKTLAGLLNQLGSFSSSGFGSGNGVLTNSTNNDIISIGTINIEGSNITDINSFKNALMNLKSEVIQRAYRI